MTKKNFLTTLLTAFFAVCAMSLFAQAERQQTPSKAEVRQAMKYEQAKAKAEARRLVRQNLMNKLDAEKKLDWGALNTTSKESLEFWGKVDQSALTQEEKNYVNNIIKGMTGKLKQMGY